VLTALERAKTAQDCNKARTEMKINRIKRWRIQFTATFRDAT